jgi:erythromycin esterase-like protein
MSCCTGIAFSLVNQAKPRQAKTSQAKPRQAKPRQAKPSQAKTRQDKTRQAKPSQDKTRQDKTSKQRIIKTAMYYLLGPTSRFATISELFGDKSWTSSSGLTTMSEVAAIILHFAFVALEGGRPYIKSIRFERLN